MNPFLMSHLEIPGSPEIAVYEAAGEDRRNIVAIGGFWPQSISEGTLGEALAQAALEGDHCTMIDLASTGNSMHSDGLTMERWLSDLEFIYEERVREPAIWVGASVGAWLMLILHARHPEWFQAMCALAPAVDWDVQYLKPGIRSGRFPRNRKSIVCKESVYVPVSLFDSMSAHHLLESPLEISAPLHVIQGALDEIAHPASTQRLLEQLKGAPATLEMVELGDHDVSKLATAEARRLFEAWLARQAVSSPVLAGMTSTT
jgi:pimeloyl-ACP methyl ester carboxylesterase